MRILIWAAVLLSLALAQGGTIGTGRIVNGLTERDVETLLRQEGIPFERVGNSKYHLRIAGVRVVLLMDRCQSGSCEILTLASGFTMDTPPSLEEVNEWNQNKRFSRAYLDSDGDPWVESELHLRFGVTSETIRFFLAVFSKETLPKFIEHIGFNP
ncbi:putative bacterial sensory transduction regulator [Meiothermus luteus]|jgi:hypothetical protein|uniref:Putative bacterial sensory transduction regulator n=1 Tax=Meiothermus luteus TaxID=2026184 RepID=A0A399EHU5_9DEIN|nr:YbjN domain-containing protein [Meiothermus luteus]RIH81831.1 putative bacterial sensory transduction regulator [Meiothermus luteus]RMH57550.1 MAG: YbjN domain-containing protein [Deinococcota bacterium]